jgi:predicted RNase H-like HicB family nuclease
VNLTVTFDRESDGRWIAEVAELPGVMTYGTSRDDALAHVQALALKTLAEMLEFGELLPTETITFTEPKAA